MKTHHILPLVPALLLTLLCAACGTPSGDAPSTADTPDNQTLAACERVLSQYRDLYATAQRVSDIDYYDWMDRYSESCRTSHPLVSPCYLDFFTVENTYYYAWKDLDENGTQELLVGGASQPGSVPQILAFYLFDNGEVYMEDAIYRVPLGDGTFLETGNGWMSGTVYRIAADGISLEEDPDTDIPDNVFIDYLDLSGHGGFLADSLEWTLLTAQ